MTSFYKTSPSHVCATIRVTGDKCIADPCYIIPAEKWNKFCEIFIPAKDGDVIEFEGVRFKLKLTGGDGVYKGVAVDTATLAYFSLSDAQKAFNLKLYEV